MTIPDSVTSISKDILQTDNSGISRLGTFSFFPSYIYSVRFTVPYKAMKKYLLSWTPNKKYVEYIINVEENPNMANAWRWPDNGKMIIPDSITSIGYKMFQGRDDLKSITIPDSVLSIGEDAFLGCKNLKNVYVYSDRVRQLVIGESHIDQKKIKVIK